VGVVNRYGDGSALGDTMHATHMISPNTSCSEPEVGVSIVPTGVVIALSGWILGCTIGTQVTEAS